MTKRVREILSYYDSENAGVRTNLARMLNHGKLAGTGKFVILPVDQGFEHGPARSFAVNPPAYDPRYHFQPAIDVVAYAEQIAAQLGANMVKVKPPTSFIEQPEAKKVYEACKIPLETLA